MHLSVIDKFPLQTLASVVTDSKFIDKETRVLTSDFPGYGMSNDRKTVAKSTQEIRHQRP